MLKIAVVGSRTFKDYDGLTRALNYVLAELGEFIVVSGGAPGADSLATRWANEYTTVVPIVYPAFWSDLSHPDAVIKYKRNGEKYDASAGFRRNQQIVDEADALLAFMDPDKPTPGTSDTIERARRKGIPVVVYRPSRKK